MVSIAFCFWWIVALSSTGGEAGGPEFSDVFLAGKDGFKSIRIPSVIVTQRGSILAFAEGRTDNADQAKNRIVVKRSSDGGRSWGKIVVIAEDGDRSLNNPCVVADRGSGRLFMMYQSYPAGIKEGGREIQTGYDGDSIVRNILITSEDDGYTWSTPRDLTREVKRPARVTTIAGGPGIGIQARHGTHAGRLLFPFNEGPFGQWNIYSVFSDDTGKTWGRGSVAPRALIQDSEGDTVSTVNEAQFVELKDGLIRFNARRWGGRSLRKTCTSSDGGETWSSIDDVPELQDPGCMASIFRLSDPADGLKSRILFSGPQSIKRENGTIFLSYDEGMSWPVQRVLFKGSFAYSVLTALPDGTIGCLFETDEYARIVFGTCTLEWLTNGKDRGLEE